MYRYHQTFKVTGTMAFPTDMLRYDHCWPRNESEVGLFRDSIDVHREVRTIELARHVTGAKDLPTFGRWESFGWKVSDVATRKL